MLMVHIQLILIVETPDPPTEQGRSEARGVRDLDRFGSLAGRVGVS